MIAQILRDFAALFVVTDPSGRGGHGDDGGLYSGASDSGLTPSGTTLWLLALIVLAGAVVRFWAWAPSVFTATKKPWRCLL